VTNLPHVLDDDDMGQGDERGFVYNAPALPDPPSFNGSTKSERRTFIRQYNKYQANVLQLNGSRPFVMPVSACIVVFAKKRVAMLDMANRDYRSITEAEWAAWFSKAFEEEPQDLEVLKKRLTTAIRIVDIMVKAIKPFGLQKSVQRQLALQRNKPLKSKVYRFVDWLRVHTAGYYLYAPVEDEKTSAPPAMAAAAPSRPSKPGRSEGSVSSSSGPPRRTPTPEQDSAKYERKKATCLKCGSENHKAVNCPKCAPGDARNRKVTKLQGSANKSLGREAKIEGIVSVTTTLLDTGSHVTLVTAGVMKSLERARVEVKMISPEPSVNQPYGQAPALKVDRQVQFKLVTLDTPCGPLTLCGLKAWVDAAELLSSRAVMERLGFSEEDLLSHAFAKQEVWDVSDVDKPSAMASVSRLTQVAAQAKSVVMTACTVPPPTSKSHLLKTQKASGTGGERWLKP
ncbi:hypothetical protein DYB28_011921, partial [Aphanomyces astaci]